MSENHQEHEKMLSLIDQYKMNELESNAFRLSLFWSELSKKYFPNYDHIRIKKGDPRKSNLFKICYKLVKETQGLLDVCDYQLYIKSQLDVLKYITDKTGEHPFISPTCLIGEKAWKRWKIWKKRYESIIFTKSLDLKITAPHQKIIHSLNMTYDFLKSKMSLSFDCFEKNHDNLLLWIKLNKISPYYLCCSPFIKSILKEKEFYALSIDLKVYEQTIDSTIQSYFKQKFSYEFSDLKS